MLFKAFSRVLVLVSLCALFAAVSSKPARHSRGSLERRITNHAASGTKTLKQYDARIPHTHTRTKRQVSAAANRVGGGTTADPNAPAAAPAPGTAPGSDSDNQRSGSTANSENGGTSSTTDSASGGTGSTTDSSSGGTGSTTNSIVGGTGGSLVNLDVDGTISASKDAITPRGVLEDIVENKLPGGSLIAEGQAAVNDLGLSTEGLPGTILGSSS